jgi:hypothetical protein
LTTSFLIVLPALLVISCTNTDTSGESRSSKPKGRTLSIREKERLVWRYFQKVETELRNDLGVSEDSLEERIQQLIDGGHIVKPVVFYITENGWATKALDYKSYKAYRESHSIDGAAPLVAQSDSVSYDALRDDLLRVFGEDSLFRIRNPAENAVD